MSLLKSFCLKAGGLRTCNATTVNPFRKISYGFFSILAALKPDFPNVAYVSTGGKAGITLFYACKNLDAFALTPVIASTINKTEEIFKYIFLVTKKAF